MCLKWTRARKDVPEDKPVITDKRGRVKRKRYVNYVTELMDGLEDSTTDTDIISHYLSAACAGRFALSQESSHNQLSETERGYRTRLKWDACEIRDQRFTNYKSKKKNVFTHLNYIEISTLFKGMLWHAVTWHSRPDISHMHAYLSQYKVSYKQKGFYPNKLKRNFNRNDAYNVKCNVFNFA